jgi:hypothetical protein
MTWEALAGTKANALHLTTPVRKTIRLERVSHD